MRSTRPILLAEDDDVDAMTVSRAFRDLGVKNKLLRFKNGEEALAYLERPESEIPGLILIDLNMPRMGGMELIRHIKVNDHLQSIPVVVLTTSREERDKTASFDLCVAGYVIKPVDYESFLDAVRIIDIYWSINELPRALAGCP